MSVAPVSSVTVHSWVIITHAGTLCSATLTAKGPKMQCLIIIYTFRVPKAMQYDEKNVLE